MTRISYHRNDDGFAIKAEGHAGYAKPGEDIVCAAVSVLLQTLAYRIMDLTTNYIYEVNNAYFYLECSCEDARESFNTILLGLEMIEAEYPKHVKLLGGCPIIHMRKL